MTDIDKKNENDRAFRILIRIDENHLRLASVYEGLVDRDFEFAEVKIISIIQDLRLIIKSLKEDDF